MCGNTSVSRDGLVSPPAEPQHPISAAKGWNQIADRTMWLRYSGSEPGRVDLFVDRTGNLSTEILAPKRGVDLQRPSKQGGFLATGGYAALAAAIAGKGAAKPYTHSGGHIVGDDPKTAVFVIDRIFRGRGVSGKDAGPEGPRPLGGYRRRGP